MPYRKLCRLSFFFFIESDLWVQKKLCNFSYTEVNVMLYANSFLPRMSLLKVWLYFSCIFMHNWKQFSRCELFNIWNQNRTLVSALTLHNEEAHWLNERMEKMKVKQNWIQASSWICWHCLHMNAEQITCWAVGSPPKYILNELSIAAHLID